MNNIKNILTELKDMKEDLHSAIDYEERKENFDMCKSLQNDLLKVMKAIHALED